MDKSHFSRVLTLLRKEKGVSQKSAAYELGVSQSLLSHYEKGIRECGLEFLVKAAAYYSVTTDYLLGISYDKNGNTISVDQLPEVEKTSKTNVGINSMLPTLNKKLICNSISLIMDKLASLNNKDVTNDVSAYLSLSVYNVFRILYSSNSENPDQAFQTNINQLPYASDIAMKASLMNVIEKLPSDVETMKLDVNTLKSDYPEAVASLINLIQNSENKINEHKK